MVPVVDLARRGTRFAEAFGAATDRIVRSGWYLLGEELASFEHEWAEFTGARHAVGVASGASALQLGLQAVGVGPGSEVVVPAFTAVPTVSAVIATGATPVLADVDPDTACIDFDHVRSLIGPSTAAVIVVHLYGYPVDIPTLGVPVIEDAAQAHGALNDVGRSVLTAYSFYPTKNLGGIGDGGAVVTSDSSIAEYVRLARAHGMREQYVHEIVAQNHRMSELEAAWLRIALSELAADVEVRRRVAEQYRSAAPQLRWQSAHERHAYHLCVIRHPERSRLRERLAAAGIGTAVHYPLAISEQPAYQTLARGHVPHAEDWAKQCVSLPCFAELNADEILATSQALEIVARD